jgi:hypothetical protein
LLFSYILFYIYSRSSAIGVASLIGSRYTIEYAIVGARIGYAATGVGSLSVAFGSRSLAEEYEMGTWVADGYATHSFFF